MVKPFMTDPLKTRQHLTDYIEYMHAPEKIYGSFRHLSSYLTCQGYVYMHLQLVFSPAISAKALSSIKS